MEKTYVVYLHLKKGTNDVFYVGVGSEKRAYSTNKRNNIWTNYFNKYDRDVKIINYDISYEDALCIEQELIICFGRLGFEKKGTLTNRVIKVGTHFKGRKHNKKTLLKMSESAKNRMSKNKKVIWKGNLYKSLRECSRKENIPFSTLQKYANWDKIRYCNLI